MPSVIITVSLPFASFRLKKPSYFALLILWRLGLTPVTSLPYTASIFPAEIMGMMTLLAKLNLPTRLKSICWSGDIFSWAETRGIYLSSFFSFKISMNSCSMPSSQCPILCLSTIPSVKILLVLRYSTAGFRCKDPAFRSDLWQNSTNCLRIWSALIWRNISVFVFNSGSNSLNPSDIFCSRNVFDIKYRNRIQHPQGSAMQWIHFIAQIMLAKPRIGWKSVFNLSWQPESFPLASRNLLKHESTHRWNRVRRWRLGHRNQWQASDPCSKS